jgi:hypothetical protein
MADNAVQFLRPLVIPRLRAEILCSGLEWSPRRKLAAAHLSDAPGADTLQTASWASSTDSPPSNDPMFKVLDGRLPQSDRTRD